MSFSLQSFEVGVITTFILQIKKEILQEVGHFPNQPKSSLLVKSQARNWVGLYESKSPRYPLGLTAAVNQH